MYADYAMGKLAELIMLMMEKMAGQRNGLSLKLQKVISQILLSASCKIDKFACGMDDFDSINHGQM